MKRSDLANVGITFAPGPHTYTRNSDGKQLQGVTKMIHDMLYPDEYACVNTDVLNAKAEYGTLRHHEIQDMIVFGDEPQTDAQMKFTIMMADHQLHPFASEYTVTDGEDFASCIDVVAHDDEDCISLVDIKTLASLNRQKVSWQLSFYAEWFELCNPGKHVHHLWAAWIPKTGMAKLVEIPRKSAEELSALATAWLHGDTYEQHSKLNQSLLARITEIKSNMALLEDEYKQLAAQLMADMQQAGEISYKDDFVTISLRAETTSQRFDSKAFQTDCPELYSKYSKPSKVAASLTVKLK